MPPPPPISTLFPYTTLFRSEEALMTIESGKLDALLHPAFDPKAQFEVLATGVNASPGAAKGEVERRMQQRIRSEEHTSELQSRQYLVCRLLLEKKKKHKKQI